MADLRKLKLVSDMVADGRITVRAELRRGNFQTGYAPSSNPSENYYAVYGDYKDLVTLEKEGCVATYKRPRSQLGEKSGEQHKYYLANLAPDELLKLSDPTPLHHDVFAVKGAVRMQAMGLYHTQQPLDGAEGETLSYLAMSADNRESFKTAIDRLTSDDHPEMMLARHFTSPRTEMAVLPVRRSMADAIARAHARDGLVEIAASGLADEPVSMNAMNKVLLHLHDDERFVVTEAGRALPAEKPAPAEPVPQAPLKSQPLKAWIAELAPYAIAFERHEQLGGGASTRLALKMDRGLPDIVRQMMDPRQCPDRNGFFLAAVSGRMGERVEQMINAETYAALRAQWPTLETHTTVQDLHPNLLRSALVGSDPRNRVRMSIDELRLARTEQDGVVQDWLAVTAPTMQRAEIFASNVGIGADRQRPITHGGELPAIMLLPVSAAVSKSIIANRRDKVQHDETPYASMEEMQAALRVNVRDRTLLTDMQASEPKPKLVPIAAANAAARPDEAIIRQRAGNVLFDNTAAANRLWVHYARHQPAKRGAQKQEVVCVGIRMPSNEAKEFEKDLRATGFLDLPGREFNYIGSTGSGASKHHLFELRMRSQDAIAWRDAATNDTHWPQTRQPGEPQRLITLKHGQVNRVIRLLMRNSEAREKPEETAWRRLATLANDGALRCVQVRFSADDLRHMGQPLERQLSVISGVAELREALAMVRDTWDERGRPIHLHPVDDTLRALDADTRSMAGSMGQLKNRAEAVASQRKDFFRWIDHQPKNEDGSVTLQYLVMPDPRNATLQHLRAADQFSTSKGQGNLLPQKTYIYDRILEDGKPLHVTPITPAFISQLAAHQGHLESLSSEPVMLSGLNAHLRGAYGKREQQAKPYDTAAVASELEQARARKARKNLIEHHFPSNRNLMLYGQLRAENNLANLGDRPAHDRIGTQHGLMLHLDSRRQWTQQIKPMLIEMQRAAVLDARKSYVMPLANVDPTSILDRVATLDDEVKQLSNLAYAAQQLTANPNEQFQQTLWNSSLSQFFLDSHLLPESLQPFVHELRERRALGGDNARASMVAHVLEVVEDKAAALRTLRMQCADVEETFDDAVAIARRHGMMRQEHEPLFYLQGETEGFTLDQLDAHLSKHFNGRTGTPLNILTYLSHNNSALQGDLSDVNIIRQLRNAPPDPAASRGEWTGRLGRKRVECPSNVTQAGFFAAAEKVFSPSLSR